MKCNIFFIQLLSKTAFDFNNLTSFEDRLKCNFIQLKKIEINNIFD